MTENGKHKEAEKTVPPKLVIEGTLMGAAAALIEIAQRVVNGDLGTTEADKATKAIGGVTNIAKTQLDALRLADKGSSITRENAMRTINVSAPARIEDKSAEEKVKGN